MDKEWHVLSSQDYIKYIKYQINKNLMEELARYFLEQISLNIKNGGNKETNLAKLYKISTILLTFNKERKGEQLLGMDRD